MKKILLVLSALFLAASAFASDRITATITVTNLTVNGQTLTVNGSVRTFTNNVVVASTQVATNADATGCGSKTNLFNQISLNLFSFVTPINTGSNTFQLQGACGSALTVTIGGTWASVSYSTQTCAVATPVGVPFAWYYASLVARTNTASQLAADLDNYDTNSVFVDLTKTQTVAGRKLFNNTNNAVHGIFYSDTYLDHAGSPLLQRDQAGTQTSLYDEHGSVRLILSDVSTAITGTNGSGFYVTPSVVAAVDQQGVFRFYGDLTTTSIADSNNVIRLYADAATIQLLDAAAKIRFEAKSDGTRLHDQLGSSQVRVDTNGLTVTNLTAANVVAAKLNAQFAGLNNFPANSDLAFSRFAISSLANGNNAALAVGTNCFAEVSGPSASFSINGIAGGRDGKILIIYNGTGQDCTFANQSGSDPTPANRIICMTGADEATTGNGAAMLIYSGSSARWLLINLKP